MSDPIAELIAREELPDDYVEVVETHWKPLATRIAREAANRKPLIVGINGAQGAGKTTLCKFLELLLKKRGLRAITLSLDDLYLTHSERLQLAAEVHPLFATRGVPGTHAVALAFSILEDVLAGRTFEIPRFDKSCDDRSNAVTRISGPVDVVLFEGWCVSAAAQPPEKLKRPINVLEAEEDPDAVWRTLANHWLGEDYKKLFGLIDLLVMLKVDHFDAVLANRRKQEQKLADLNPLGSGILDEDEMVRFVSHYERLTRHMLEEMPERADVVISIDGQQRPRD
ncbi:kinase [Aurantiacibacter sp. D1-12]|uniref:kinase n=1 Tax=Aurantiacibacter sp. D1-12 TaxID=2993658 RepID=UPI00237C542A|nr:kinase [Aurantiacibacter sp. D1-12]MDE1466207.1 kinase [Aurantiacibacter sp. D1-12]